MKKLYSGFAWIFLVFMMFPSLSKAQTFVIGNGTSYNDQYTYPTPFGQWFTNMRAQFLYTASEMSAAGMYPGAITHIAFYVNATNGAAALQSYKLYMKTTSTSSLSTYETGMGSPLFGPTTINPGTGWYSFALSTPMIWNGSDNIVIEVCFDNGTNSWTYNHSVTWTTGLSFNASYFFYSDSQNGCGNTNSNSYNQNYRPNARFTVLPPVANDAGVANILSPALPTCDLDSIDIEVTVNNLGSDTLNSCLIKWQIGSGSITTFNYSGSVAPLGGTDVVTIATHSFSNGDQLHIWTELPNGVPDSIPVNNNGNITVQTGLSGTYAIPGDYATLNAAATALNSFGVCDDVVFELANGTYTEQVTFGAVMGVSEDATVTFTSASGDQDDVTIQYTSTTQADNWVVNLNGSDWFTFKDLTVRNNGTGNYTNVFDLLSGANNNTIRDCRIIGGTATYYGAGNYMSNIYMSGPNQGNSILDNTIENGSCGIYSNASASSRANGLLIEGNTVKNAFYYGMYINYTDHADVLHNTITANSILYEYSYGLYLAYSDKFDIIGNYIGANFNQGFYYPLYMYFCTGSSNPRSQVSNNCIHGGTETSTSYCYYGAYAYSSGLFDMTNNTIVKRGSNGGYALNLYLGGLIQLKNNNIANLTGGYALYCYGAFTMTTSDHNNFYTATGTPFLWGTTNYSSIEAYQTASGYDMNSLTVNPDFQNEMTCVTCSEDLDGAGSPSNITDDIQGNNRSIATPDIGALEYVTGDNFSLGPDTTMCASEFLVEAGPAQLVVWDVNGSFTSGPTYNLEAVPGAPQTFNVKANVTTLFCGSGSDTVVITLVPDATLDSAMHICAGETATLTPGGGANAVFTWNTEENTASIEVSEPGVYTVTKVEDGCESQATTELTVSTAVDILDFEACEDDAPVTVDATIPDGNSYAWSGGSSINTASNTFDTEGQYSVTATDIHACTSVDSFDLYLLGEPVADITYTATGGTAIFFSGLNSDEISPGTSFLWTFNGSDTSSSSTPFYIFPWSATPVTYNVILSIDNGCGIDEDQIQVTIDPLGVKEIAANQNFAVFPNPANDVVYLKSAAGWSTLEVTITDNAGRLVKTVTYNAANELIEMNTSELPGGSYMVKLTSDLSTEVHSLIVH